MEIEKNINKPKIKFSKSNKINMEDIKLQMKKT